MINGWSLVSLSLVALLWPLGCNQGSRSSPEQAAAPEEDGNQDLAIQTAVLEHLFVHNDRHGAVAEPEIYCVGVGTGFRFSQAELELDEDGWASDHLGFIQRLGELRWADASKRLLDRLKADVPVVGDSACEPREVGDDVIERWVERRSNKPAIRFRVSQVAHRIPNVAVIYAQFNETGLSGGGYVCRLIRAGGPWKIDRCKQRWLA